MNTMRIRRETATMSRKFVGALAVLVVMGGAGLIADATLYDDGACPLFALLPFTSM